ncbi:hypothetical protein VK96_25770 [Bacillus cereus]|uniref:S8 family peptidase n=1 Tax=Bacillus cereus TaxID=1396 RepID=UPI00065D194D|nr:S8 family peptidase [Bacillus cereus]KMN65687.1 hypothetical protein VK96_25770 [Bacillus cereus]
MTNDFPHLSLKLIKDAPPQKRSWGGPKENPITTRNKVNREEHASNLMNSVKKITHNWNENIQKRKQNSDVNLPEMPEAVSLHLRIDTNTFPVEELRKFNIEVVGELEEGYVIGASEDTSLNTLSEKIGKFSERKQNNIASLWEIAEGIEWKREILSFGLFQAYENLNDNDFLYLDIGISCLSTIYVPDHPSKRKKSYKGDEERYQKAVERWKKKRDKAYSDWNSIAAERANQFEDIITGYGGTVFSLEHGEMEGSSLLPDSINSRVKITVACMKDLLQNYPFIFEISEVEEVTHTYDAIEEPEETLEINRVDLIEPTNDSPHICIIDSGIAEQHILLRQAIKEDDSRSWIEDRNDVADYVEGGGHGTKVAGGVLYHDNVPLNNSRIELPFWLQNARVLDRDNEMPVELSPSSVLREIIELYYEGKTRTRIYNHSINSLSPYSNVHMSPWASTIDQLSWESDVVFIVSCGNIPPEKDGDATRLGILDHYNLGMKYPNYLLESSARVSNPAQSLLAITVGSVGVGVLTGETWKSFSRESEPSSFSCTGPGIWGSIKPEVVECGGDFAYNESSNSLTLRLDRELTPILVRSTMHGGAPVGRDEIGTSFSTAKITNVMANIQKNFPFESTLFYKTLLIQSARWPEWAENHPRKEEVIRSLGYGIPDKMGATENDPHRVTLITKGDNKIKGGQVHVYEVKIPEELYVPSSNYNIRVDITLSYKACPRRTRRNRKRYFSKWLEWQTSKQNELPMEFLSRVIDLAKEGIEYNTSEDEGSEVFKWMIRERDDWGQIKGINRNSSTIQKDWAVVESNKLREGFCVAVIGHHGWNNEPDVEVPYCLSVKFEAVDKDIELYQLINIRNAIEVDINL